MQVWNLLHAARWKHRTQKSRQKSPSGHHRTTLSGYIFATNAHIDNREKNLLSSNMSPQYDELQPTSGWDRFISLGHPCKFQRLSRLGVLMHGSQVLSVSQTLRHWTEGATYVRQGDHHVGHWSTFLVGFTSFFIYFLLHFLAYCMHLIFYSAVVFLLVCGCFWSVVNLLWIEMCQVERKVQWLRSCIDFTTRCLLASAQRKLLGRCWKSWAKTAKNLRRIIVVSWSSCYSSCMLVDMFSQRLCLTGHFMHVDSGSGQVLQKILLSL